MNSEGKALGSLVAHALALGRQGSCVGPFAVNGPFTRMSGKRKRMIFLLTTINKGIRTKSLQGFYAPASHLMPTKSSKGILMAYRSGVPSQRSGTRERSPGSPATEGHAYCPLSRETAGLGCVLLDCLET